MTNSLNIAAIATVAFMTVFMAVALLNVGNFG